MLHASAWTTAMLAALLVCAPCGAQTLVVLDFEMIDDLGDPGSSREDARRMADASHALHAALAACGSFQLRAPGEAVESARARNRYLHRCNGCTRTIAGEAGARLVLFPWVQKVSNLILNINAEIRDAQTEAVVATRSVDIRGNNDVSWQRGVHALARRLCPDAGN